MVRSSPKRKSRRDPERNWVKKSRRKSRHKSSKICKSRRKSGKMCKSRHKSQRKSRHKSQRKSRHKSQRKSRHKSQRKSSKMCKSRCMFKSNSQRKYSKMIQLSDNQLDISTKRKQLEDKRRILEQKIIIKKSEKPTFEQKIKKRYDDEEFSESGRRLSTNELTIALKNDPEHIKYLSELEILQEHLYAITNQIINQTGNDLVDHLNLDTCSICLENITNPCHKPIDITSCQHYFHNSCLNRWTSTQEHANCPHCRANIQQKVTLDSAYLAAGCARQGGWKF